MKVNRKIKRAAFSKLKKSGNPNVRYNEKGEEIDWYKYGVQWIIDTNRNIKYLGV